MTAATLSGRVGRRAARGAATVLRNWLLFAILVVAWEFAAHAVKPRILKVRMRIASEAAFTSYDSIFLPRYSGVRPTISPAMKIAMTMNTSMP